MDSMMARGTKHTLEEEELWDLPPTETAEGLSARLNQHWTKQLAKKKYELIPFFSRLC